MKTSKNFKINVNEVNDEKSVSNPLHQSTKNLNINYLYESQDLKSTYISMNYT